DPGDRDARLHQHLQADAVESAEGLGFATGVIDIDAPVREHTIDIASEKANPARLRDGRNTHHTTRARKRSCRWSAPTSRRSSSTTSSTVTLGTDSIN